MKRRCDTSQKCIAACQISELLSKVLEVHGIIKGS